MKRSIPFLLSVVFLAVLLAGCTVVRGALRRVLPDSTDAATQTSASAAIETTPTAVPEATSTPVAATAEPSPTANPNEYVSAALGVAFTVPESWAGKYRVEEGDGYLSVYFVPSEPMDESMGDGFLFTIARKTMAEEDYFLDSVIIADIDGASYICGTSTDVSYGSDQPEYEKYAAMLAEYPAVIRTLRAAD